MYVFSVILRLVSQIKIGASYGSLLIRLK